MSWTANIPPDEMAVSLCDDLLKKMGQLRNMQPEKSRKILEGVIDGLLNHTLPHPYEGVPGYLKSMDPDYVVGHGVGMTWQRVAREWREIGEGPEHLGTYIPDEEGFPELFQADTLKQVEGLGYRQLACLSAHCLHLMAERGRNFQPNAQG